MWMRSDAHGVLLFGRAKVINEAPGSNRSDITMWESSLNIYARAGRQLNGTGRDNHEAGM